MGAMNLISSLIEKGEKLQTSAGTMGALTAVADSSPFKAPTTASAISIATPSCQKYFKTMLIVTPIRTHITYSI
jgi:response regulator of citrate/malate metabolism